MKCQDMHEGKSDLSVGRQRENLEFTKSPKQRKSFEFYILLFFFLFLCSFIHCFKNRTGPTGQTGSTGSQSGPVKTPKTGQQSVKNRAKTWVETKIKKKNGLMSGSVFKTMVLYMLMITMMYFLLQNGVNGPVKKQRLDI